MRYYIVVRFIKPDGTGSVNVGHVDVLEPINSDVEMQMLAEEFMRQTGAVGRDPYVEFMMPLPIGGAPS